MSQISNLKIGAVAGGVTIALSLLTPMISGIFPSYFRGFFFQTYTDPISSFVNEVIIVFLALNAIQFIPAIAEFTR